MRIINIKLSYWLLVCTILTGCANYVQVVYTAPSDKSVKEEKDYYVFENDTIKVVYSFWVERGRMSFMVLNKLDIPIYIDWKKSSYIDKNMKLDYYMDKELRKSSSITAGYFYKDPVNWSTIFGPTIVTGTVGYESITREERVTFIPPKSYIFRGFYRLMPSSYFTMPDAVKREMPVSPNDSSKTFTAYFITAEKGKSTFVFRNFLTYSTKENFEKESYVNNEFYVRKVVAIHQNNFNKYDSHTETYENDWEDARRFFIRNLDKYSLQIP